MPAPYTGELRKGSEPNTITGRLVDGWGWEIQLTGTRQADGSYKLDGILGETPPALRIPGLDDAG